MTKAILKLECIRLRQEERLSIREIEARTGASKGSLSTWLRPYPLTREEQRTKHPVPPVNPRCDRGEMSTLYQIVQMSQLKTNQVGKLAEAAIMLRLLARGFMVFGSMFDGDTADWVVQAPGSSVLHVLQVKTVRRDPRSGFGVGVTSLRNSRGRRYESGEFHFIAGYDLYTDTAYVWSWEEVSHLRTAVSVSVEAAERWDKIR